jgi:hypothetical protein
MKRVTTICLATVLGCVAAVSAEAQYGQTQQTETQRERPATTDRTGQPQTETQAQAQARNAATTSFIGCVEGGTTANSFVLNVVELPASPTAQRGTQAIGTTGVMVGQRVQLIGANNLAAHRGHKVEITGMIVPQGTATGRGGQAAADMRLNVTNLRHINTMCAPAPTTQGTSGTTSRPMPAPQNQTPQPQQGTPDQPQ